MSAARKCLKCGQRLVGESLEVNCPQCIGSFVFGGNAAAPKLNPSESPPDDDDEPPVLPATSSDTDDARRFGEYELIEEIAQGAMGVVYKARQSALDRIVAVKMISNGQLATEAELKRFRAEAKAAANLDHPNIVPIHGAGSHNGRHYFSMKLIDGEALSQRIGFYQGKPHAAAALIAKVARAAHHAHKQGILHRDLKPGNILIDRNGEPHVADFGLASRSQPGAQSNEGALIVGTPGYMAPEQAQFATESHTPASDVFGLGAILYELLASHPPFQGKDVRETLKLTRTSTPSSLQGIKPPVDPKLEAICLKCLRKEPRERYSSAATLASELEHWSQQTNPAHPNNTWWSIRRPIRRNLRNAVFSAVVAAVFILGISGVFRLPSQTPPTTKPRQERLTAGVPTNRNTGPPAGMAGALDEQPLLVNIVFGARGSPPKQGFAATGRSVGDYWNRYERDGVGGLSDGKGLLENLKTSDQAPTAIELAIENAHNSWGNGARDWMYKDYLYPFGPGNLVVTLRNAPVGYYDIYVYGHGVAEGQNGIYELNVGDTDYGRKSTGATAEWRSSDWREGVQYVRYRRVAIQEPGDVITLAALPNQIGPPVIAGIQLAAAATAAPASLTEDEDEDDDGLPNRVEDANANGVVDRMETDPSKSDTDGDGLPDNQEDSDYDGVRNMDEVAEGTNPFDEDSHIPRMLGHWSFNTSEWRSHRGHLPRNSSHEHFVPGCMREALRIASDKSSHVRYYDVERDGSANINFRNGTVQFWFKPDWNSGDGKGPQTWSRLICSGGHTAAATNGCWQLSVRPNGDALRFFTQNDGVFTEHLEHPINWTSNQWRHIALTYSPKAASLYIDGKLTATGVGVKHYPNEHQRAVYGFTVGNDTFNNQPARGAFDELQTYNYPRSAQEISEYCNTIMGLRAHHGGWPGRSRSREGDPAKSSARDSAKALEDYDHDELRRRDEDANGNGIVDGLETDPDKRDTDGDGLPDGHEDSDYDGVRNMDEVDEGTNPFNPGSYLPRLLGHWKFDTSQWLNQRGDPPAQASHENLVPGWLGNALQISSQGRSGVKYNDMESDGSANINFRNGTVRFWFEPDWNSGEGPDNHSCLITAGLFSREATNGTWQLSLTPGARHLAFVTQNEGQTTNHLRFPIHWVSNRWRHVTLTYSSTNTAIYVDGRLAQTGPGLKHYPNPDQRAAYGFVVGNDPNGDQPVAGAFDELQTFNHPLSAREVSDHYKSAMAMSEQLDPRPIVSTRAVVASTQANANDE